MTHAQVKNTDLEDRRYTAFVRMPGKVAASVLADKAVIERITRAVSPSSIHFHGTPLGIGFTGDEPAVQIARRFIEDALPKDADSPPMEAALTQENLDALIAGAMKRDLAFRLEGLSRPVRPLSFAQLAFMRDLLNMSVPLILGIGPTGTGKTHLAIAASLNLLKKGEVKHIVITRARDHLDVDTSGQGGSAKSDFEILSAVFFDALRDLIDNEEINSLIESRKLEIVPLSQTRGRTFNDSFVIVDEAHNLSDRHMRMAVTRTGRRSRMVVTGDPEQGEFPAGEIGGLANLLQMLEGTDIAKVHHFEPRQVIRNKTVARLEALYANKPFEGFVDADLHAEDVERKGDDHKRHWR